MQKSAQMILSLVFISILLIQCGENIFEPLSPKDTDQAYLYAARKKIDRGEYIDAIDDLSQISTDYASQNNVRVTFASAYAGACGMEFIPFFNSISQANISPPNTLFKYLRSSFTDKATAPNYCVLSEAKLKEIGSTEALRLAAMNGSKEVNMLMAILSMAKIGSILRTKSDIDGVNSLGDGTTDATFDSCTNNDANLTDDDVLEVATGFGLLLENLTSILGAGSQTETILNGLKVIINGDGNLIPGICHPPNGSSCLLLDKNNLDPVDVPTIVNIYRDLLKSESAGIESCNNPDVTQCCP